MKHRWRRDLAALLGHPILYDEGVEACRNACIGGASIAAAAVTSAAYSENPFTGLPALRACIERLMGLPLEVERWCTELRVLHPEVVHEAEHAPGFGYVSAAQSRFVRSACIRMEARCSCSPAGTRLRFYLKHRREFDEALGPLNPTGLSALVFTDHGVSAEMAERYYLLWKMEPALREAQRSRALGISQFPFVSERFDYEGAWPERHSLNLAELEREVGLD